MRTILVADDSLFMRKAIKDILAGRYAVVEADSGRKCVEEFSRVRPDLVLLDVVMPEGDEEGIRVLERIMALAPSTAVVMITALAQQKAVVAECTRLGAKGFISKPFNAEQVLRVVEECVGMTPP
ncbi:MAG: response regulator [Elusimicrobia bacterium]|nr:response regulator [Elusimicrobiota bacterium]